MTNYFQSYSCGHSGSYTISKRVKPGEKTAILQRVFGRPCDQCRGVNSQLSEDEIIKLNEFYQLPQLIGTPSQIAWANNIRITMYEQVMSRYALNERVQFLVHTKMVIHADYWIKYRVTPIQEFLETTEKLYGKLRNSSEKYKKLEKIRAKIEDALLQGDFEVQSTGLPDKYVVQSRGTIFGLYKFIDEAEQGIFFIKQQLKVRVSAMINQNAMTTINDLQNNEELTNFVDELGQQNRF